MEPAITNDFYSEGFFGYGLKGDFKMWSLAHFIPLIILGLGIFLIFHFRKKLASLKHEENVRFIFAAVMLFFEMAYFWRLLYVGSGSTEKTNLLTKLPLQVCEWSCIFACFMLMKKSPSLYQICFFTCLTAGIFPLFLPSVISTTGPTYFRYYQYWAEHILPILAVFYMTFVYGYRPSIKEIYKPFIFLFTLAVIACIANYYIPDANYLYLAHDTTGISITSWLPDNVFLKLFVLSIGALSLFVIVYFASKLVMSLYSKWEEKKKLQEAK
ncbi:MAG: TIGR02206 family membrane protein [Bacilli bacterium]|jgi:hypothetical integral membrane protein (TIGR02206 family)